MPVRPERVWGRLSDKLRGEIVQDLAAILAEVIHEIGTHHRPASGAVRGHLRSPVQPAPGADEPGDQWPNLRMVAFADELLVRGGRLPAALGRHYARQLAAQPWVEEAMRRGGRGREVDMGLGSARS